jgi:hypothetical protein
VVLAQQLWQYFSYLAVVVCDFTHKQYVAKNGILKKQAGAKLLSIFPNIQVSFH